MGEALGETIPYKGTPHDKRGPMETRLWLFGMVELAIPVAIYAFHSSSSEDYCTLEAFANGSAPKSNAMPGRMEPNITAIEK